MYVCVRFFVCVRVCIYVEGIAWEMGVRSCMCVCPCVYVLNYMSVYKEVFKYVYCGCLLQPEYLNNTSSNSRRVPRALNIVRMTLRYVIRFTW